MYGHVLTCISFRNNIQTLFVWICPNSPRALLLVWLFQWVHFFSMQWVSHVALVHIVIFIVRAYVVEVRSRPIQYFLLIEIMASSATHSLELFFHSTVKVRLNFKDNCGVEEEYMEKPSLSAMCRTTVFLWRMCLHSCSSWWMYSIYLRNKSRATKCDWDYKSREIINVMV